jgi:hypothetical protein
MEPEKEAAHDEAMRHMKKATELLRKSLKVHEAEMAGGLTHEEAIPMATGLNEQAAAESDLATEAIRTFLDDRPKRD